MKREKWTPGIPVLLLTLAVSAFAEDTGKGDIPREEYEIYTLAMAAIGGAASLGSETLQGLWADYLLNFFEDPVKPGPGLVQDFNEKNKDKSRLAESFVQASKAETVRPFDQKRKATFSRVGFDLQRSRALVVVGLTYVVPEDVMNEGKFILLHKKEGKWAVEKTLEAWPMRLGDL